MDLPIFASKSNFEDAIEIVKSFAAQKNLDCNLEQLQNIVLDIMEISDSHGGGYNKDTIYGFCLGYFDSKLYQKVIGECSNG